MSNNDKLFLAAVSRVIEHNHANPDNQKTITTYKDVLSKDLLDTMDADGKSFGCWFMGVYINFEPMYKESPAKSWQQPEVAFARS